MILVWIIEKLLKLVYPFLYWNESDKKTIIYDTKEFGKFRLRVNTYDKFALLEVLETREYFDSDFKINPDDIVIDIGAHIGVFSIYAAKQANKGNVYSYEPDKENFKILSENIASNNIKNIHLFNKAVSGKKGTYDFFIKKTNSMHSLYGKSFEKKIEVSTLTLRDILTENGLSKVNFLKIDAEGAEYDILLSEPSCLLKKVDKIVVEYHDYLDHKHNHRELIKHLEKNGFKISNQFNRPMITSRASLGERLIVFTLLSLRKFIKQGTIKARK